MFYSPLKAYSLMEEFPELSHHLISINEKMILNILNDKIHTRIWMKNHITTPNSITLHGNECTYEYLTKIFNCDEFVIQERFSAGGLGTHLLTKENKNIISKMLSNKEYLISKYIEHSASVNLHIFITKENVIVFPGSIQLIDYRNNQYIYSGADFCAYKYIDENYKNKLYLQSKKIGNILKELGYLGICGIDYLISNDNVYFVELNPRFQASTILLNLELSNRKLPSIHQMQFDVLKPYTLNEIKTLEELDINYSFYKYGNNLYQDIDMYNYQMTLLENTNETYQILYDGYDRQNIFDNKYLFSVIFNGNISSFVSDNLMHIHPNLQFNNFVTDVLPIDNNKSKLIRLKIALLNQGIRIDQSAKKEFTMKGGYNESVFSSIDLTINNIRINTQINTRLSSMSPFSLAHNQTFILKYCGKIICKVDVEMSKSIKDLKTRNGIPYKNIAFISGDRLRIKPERKCYYKATQQGCSFCPNNEKQKNIENYKIEDIYEVIDYCFKNEQFRHILIGGGTADPKQHSETIISVASYIKSISDKSIYLMCTPPDRIETINDYVDNGIKELAFNVELFDRDLAIKYMPGKGKITLPKYLLSLKTAVDLLGESGSVRSMLVVGLESSEKTLSAVKLLCENGIQPMLSIYRPTDNCKLKYIVQPSNEELLQIFNSAEKICSKFNLKLGPSCPSCQNNTLSLTTE